MLPTLQKHSVIAAALIASLSLTACGNKKDVIAPAPAPKQTAPTPAPAEGAKDVQGAPAKPGEEKNSQLPQPLPDQPAPPQAPPAQPGQVVDTYPTPPPGTNPLPSDYMPGDAANVTRDGLTKRMTGGVTGDGLVYTSSSTDELLNFLRARNERVDEVTRRRNLDTAASVRSAKMTVDGLSQDVVLTLKIQEGSQVKIYNVAGTLSEGAAVPVRGVKAGNGEVTTGARPIEGTAKCLDLDGGCETTFVRLKIGPAGSSAILNVVFRNSLADLYFNLPGKYSDNPEYLLLREMALTSASNSRGLNKVDYARMNSWEVVNGRSGVALSLKSKNEELLAFSGPLLAPEAGTGVNLLLARLTKDSEDTLDLLSMQKPLLNYANSIGEARMIANNGLGQVRIALKMRQRVNFPQDQFAITFMRKIKPLVEVSDDNLK